MLLLFLRGDRLKTFLPLDAFHRRPSLVTWLLTEIKTRKFLKESNFKPNIIFLLWFSTQAWRRSRRRIFFFFRTMQNKDLIYKRSSWKESGLWICLWGQTTGAEEMLQEVDKGMQGAVPKAGVVTQISFLLIISRPALAKRNHSEICCVFVIALSLWPIIFVWLCVYNLLRRL